MVLQGIVQKGAWKSDFGGCELFYMSVLRSFCTKYALYFVYLCCGKAQIGYQND